MTRKDFRMIAKIIEAAKRKSHDIGDLTHTNYAFVLVRKVAEQMADYLGTTSPRFDRERFLKACGFSE